VDRGQRDILMRIFSNQLSCDTTFTQNCDPSRAYTGIASVCLMALTFSEPEAEYLEIAAYGPRRGLYPQFHANGVYLHPEVPRMNLVPNLVLERYLGQ
jgi:hypothetical protein